MNSKHKGQNNEGQGIGREKGIPVASDSMQTRPPGSRQSGSADVQSANIEEGTSYLRNRNAEQGQFEGSMQSERGAGTAQQAGWSSRQQAQRMQARAEQERLGAPRQSSDLGTQQDQGGGAQASRVGSPGSMQSGSAGSGQRDLNQPSASPRGHGSKRGKKKGKR
jgi:hypothetical protein